MTQQSVELRLIRQRFPDLDANDCSSLISDFFCARRVGSRNFEGRLFFTEKIILFVSTYSDAHDYDLCMMLSDVLQVTIFHKSILPAIQFSLGENEELFTNFYSLKSVVTCLNDLLPGRVLENQSNGSQRKLNRLLSVPARQRRTPTPPLTYETLVSVKHPLTEQAPICPFFSKCGFCPRLSLCKLRHEPPTTTKQERVHPHIGIHSNSSLLRLSPSKRMHLLEKSELTGAKQSGNKGSSTKKISREYTRSISSPSRILTFSQSNKLIPKRAVTDSQISALSTEGDDHEPCLVVPTHFDFTNGGRSSREDTEEAVKVKDKNMFVFSASNPSSPDKDQRKQKNPRGVTPCEGVSGTRSDGVKSEAVEVESDESLAILTQQLELGSDADSLQGDLDMDHQCRLLALFSNTDSPLGWTEVPSPPSIPKIIGSERDNSDGDAKEDVSHKRRQCLQFLGGVCQRGADCPEYHGVDPDNYDDIEAMIPDDDFSDFEIPSKLKVYPASTLRREDINSGDKIILSPHILLACEQLELSYPMAFRLEVPASGRCVHAGVLEFTSPHTDNGYLPQWMMDHLGVEPGETVDFKHVDLPKGVFVRLQPVSSAWLGIQRDKRMAMMEFQLRNFQTLTEGTKVTLTYELNKYSLKVLECRPAKGISIVDADITTDVVEPADFNRYHSIEEGQAVKTCLDQPTTCSVEENSYRHFVLLSLPGKPLPSALRMVVLSTHGDADLFLCQSCTAPTQTRYTWCDQSVGESVITLNNESGGYDVNKSLYAGVVSLCEGSEFTITFHTHSTPTNIDLSGSQSSITTGRLSHETTSITNESDSTQTTPLPPGHERCAYCGSVMPSLKLLMHERHCAQSTFKCPVCKVCLPKAAEKKHHYIAHELLKCDCGILATQLVLHKHQLTDCLKRSISCQFKWCNLSFPMDQLQNHESLCGRKKIPCPMCAEEVSQLELEIHLEAFHSVDTSKIDWTLPLANQADIFKPVVPKLVCSCGAKFEFEDDYQVHQLTECVHVQQQGPKVETENSDCKGIVG